MLPKWGTPLVLLAAPTVLWITCAAADPRSQHTDAMRGWVASTPPPHHAAYSAGDGTDGWTLRQRTNGAGGNHTCSARGSPGWAPARVPALALAWAPV